MNYWHWYWYWYWCYVFLLLTISLILFHCHQTYDFLGQQIILSSMHFSLLYFNYIHLLSSVKLDKHYLYFIWFDFFNFYVFMHFDMYTSSWNLINITINIMLVKMSFLIWILNIDININIIFHKFRFDLTYTNLYLTLFEKL